MKKLLLTILVCSVVLLADANGQGEGACLPIIRTPKDELARSDAVFVGTVLDVSEYKFEKIHGHRKTTADSGNLYKVKMKVERSWKGVKAKETSFLIYSGLHSGDLFASMKEGAKFLVYAVSWKSPDELNVSGCMRTRKIQDAKEDLAQLGKGRKIG